MIKIKFPNNDIKEFKEGIKAIEIAKSISEGLAREAVGAIINNVKRDMSFSINEDSEIKFLKFADKEGLEIFRHSSAHLLAQAVLRLFPNTKPTIGPVVEEGFYYDFDVKKPFTPKDLENIEKEMKKIVDENLIVERVELTKKEAEEIFKNNEYKIEMIQDMDEISAYKQGEFIDLCRGPHLPRTGMIKAFKIVKLAGAYWRADAKNKQLQRIYGISYPEKKM
jgi:threonyl-tRNA synthetase